MAESPLHHMAFFQELKKTGQGLSILVIGESGSGKTTLVNNLLGEEIAKEQGTCSIFVFEGMVQGVGVTLYEASNLSDADKIQDLFRSSSVTFCLYCFNMSETRMRHGIIDTFKIFHRTGIDWSKTVIALTFADSLPVPKTQRRNPNFNKKQYFIKRVKEWKDNLEQALTSTVGVPMETARLIPMLPTTSEPEVMLPTGEEWRLTLWSAVLSVTSQTDTHPNMGPNHCCTPPESVENLEQFAIASSGHPYDYAGKTYYFVESPPEWLICAVCQGVALDPEQTGCCGKIYCMSCIEQWKTRSNTCPTCRSTAQVDPPFTLFKDRHAQQDVNCLPVYCPNWKEGCDKQMGISEVDSHCTSDKGCPFQVVDCGNMCGYKGRRAAMNNHMMNTCCLRQEKCQYCSVISSQEHVTGAHLQECVNFPVTCPNMCDAHGLTRSAIPAHQEKCPLQQVECEYKQFGCAVVLPRKEVEGHLQNSVHHHLQMSLKKLEKQEIRLQKVDILEERVQVLEATIAHLVAKMKLLCI